MKTVKLLGCFVGLAFVAFLIVNTYSGINRGSSVDREGIERAKAALAELERVQKNQS